MKVRVVARSILIYVVHQLLHATEEALSQGAHNTVPRGCKVVGLEYHNYVLKFLNALVRPANYLGAVSKMFARLGLAEMELNMPVPIEFQKFGGKFRLDLSVESFKITTGNSNLHLHKFHVKNARALTSGIYASEITVNVVFHVTVGKVKGFLGPCYGGLLKLLGCSALKTKIDATLKFEKPNIKFSATADILACENEKSKHCDSLPLRLLRAFFGRSGNYTQALLKHVSDFKFTSTEFSFKNIQIKELTTSHKSTQLLNWLRDRVLGCVKKDKSNLCEKLSGHLKYLVENNVLSPQNFNWVIQEGLAKHFGNTCYKSK